MPKLIALRISVEQIALGPVMMLLHDTPGVVKFNLDFGDTKSEKAHNKANGVDAPPRKARKKYKRRTPDGVSGEQFTLRAMLAHKKPMLLSELVAAFEKDKRSAKSPSPILHFLKQKKLVNHLGMGKGYTLTQKGRGLAKKPATAHEAAS